ncbi:MAG: DUF4270 domain-containing protein [Bacteroides sp.]|nr:DUF4270 domain-containing protein [Bacteroides sp.]
MKLNRWIPAAIIGASLIACEDSTEIGSSIIEDSVEVLVDSSFTVTGFSVTNPVIQARTENQILGKIDAKGFGNFSSDFITQFMPAAGLDTFGIDIESIDSIKLRMIMKYGDCVGDTLVPMGLEVYRLDKQLQSPIYSDFDPSASYSPGDLLGSTIYTASVVGLPLSLQKSYTHPDTAIRVVDVDMPISLAHEFWDKYQSDPLIWNDPQQFAEWFPGIYVKNSFGSGRVMTFSSTAMYMYYSRHLKYDDLDTIIPGAQIFLAVTPEVINNNNFKLSISEEIENLAQTEPVVMAPIGYDVEVKLPIQDMVDKYRNRPNTFSILNSMEFNIPVEEITNKYGITPPPYLLLVRKDKKDEFFSRQQINDDISSFYAAYNSSTKSYDFTSMRQYFLEMSAKESLTEADAEFIITPVSLMTETYTNYYGQSQTMILAIVPYTNSPAMAHLNLDNAKITLTFSRQTLP